MHDVNLWPLIAIVVAIAAQVYKWSKKQAAPQSPAAAQQQPQVTAANARVAAAARAVLTARTAPVNVTLSGVPPPSPQPRPPSPRPVARQMAAAAPLNQAAFGDAVLTRSPRSFLHDTFADPTHARRAIILSELLLPPIALR